MFQRTLVIDSAMQPVDVVDWQRAILLVLTNKAKVLDEYDNVLIRSASQAYKLPSILMLMTSKAYRTKEVNFSRKGVFYRDDFTCGYCEKKFKAADLTLDHIIPVCQGGNKSWENIVSACHKCNMKKGGRTPAQAKMPLKVKVYKPNWNPTMFIQLKKNDPLEKWQEWIAFQLKSEFK